MGRWERLHGAGWAGVEAVTRAQKGQGRRESRSLGGWLVMAQEDEE